MREKNKSFSQAFGLRSHLKSGKVFLQCKKIRHCSQSYVTAAMEFDTDFSCFARGSRTGAAQKTLLLKFSHQSLRGAFPIIAVYCSYWLKVCRRSLSLSVLSAPHTDSLQIACHDRLPCTCSSPRNAWALAYLARDHYSTEDSAHLTFQPPP